MRYSLRTFIVCLMIMAMSFPPAAAWDFFHGGCGGCGSYEAVYYGPVYSGCCGGGAVGYDDCCEPCSGCEPCGGCDACGDTVVDAAPSEETPAPAPPRDAQPMMTPPQEPATVDRPIQTTPAPQVPPQEQVTPPPTEPVPPAQPPEEEPNELFNGTEDAAPPATEPPATEPPMAEPPAEEADGLFGEPTTPPAESEPAEDPAEEPLELFDEPAETEPEMPAETEEQPEDAPEETPAEEDDDIFGGTRGVLREPGGLASDDMRTWIDNTGNFTCQGRLIRFLDGQVQLVKDNGRTTTVPVYRLSASDLEFIHRQASAQRAESYQTAQSLIELPLSAN